MAFHYTRFGSFGLALQPYADLHGYVPEAGDEHAGFDWPHDDFEGEGGAECWLDHLADAEAATSRAEQRLQTWRS